MEKDANETTLSRCLSYVARWNRRRILKARRAARVETMPNSAPIAPFRDHLASKYARLKRRLSLLQTGRTLSPYTDTHRQVTIVRNFISSNIPSTYAALPLDMSEVVQPTHASCCDSQFERTFSPDSHGIHEMDDDPTNLHRERLLFHHSGADGLFFASHKRISEMDIHPASLHKGRPVFRGSGSQFHPPDLYRHISEPLYSEPPNSTNACSHDLNVPTACPHPQITPSPVLTRRKRSSVRTGNQVYSSTDWNASTACPDPQIAPSPALRRRKRASVRTSNRVKGPWSFGKPTYTCQYCGAMMWAEERCRTRGSTKDPIFMLCCSAGRVQLPLIPKPPTLLQALLDAGCDPRGAHFRCEIRTYNAMFALTSTGGKIDITINRGNGPYVYRVSGQNYHNLGSLLPVDGNRPQFAQLYIYDTQNEMPNRRAALGRNDPGDSIDDSLIEDISRMLDEHNVLVRSFRTARDRHETNPGEPFRLRLINDRHIHGNQYNQPTHNEVAGLIIADFENGPFERDVIVEHKTSGLKRVTDLHRSFMAMSYPLIHPYGEAGFHYKIPRVVPGTSTIGEGRVTMRQFYAYRFQQRLAEGQTLIKAGRLLQQYMVDAWMAIEDIRFRFARKNQDTFRADLYSGLMDASDRGDVDATKIGKTIILPSSHTGSPRYRVQNYQDAMAICRWAGYPDIFLTFTCNPKWPEFNGMLGLIGQENDTNRHDISSRVFAIKLKQFMKDLRKGQPFGPVVASLYTIEFQKRGLPHAHILLFLATGSKKPSPQRVDTLVCAELPDPATDFAAYTIVSDTMLHGPCGLANPKSPCMVNGVCSKHFPKKWNDITTTDESGFPVYRRRDTKITAKKKGHVLDNRYVIPYNRNLSVKYNAHINVEICNHSRAIKYLFKYLHKGSDRAIATFEPSDPSKGRDEIKMYLDCRYISAAEACWRIFRFDIHNRQPAVERLQCHLPGEQTVVFNETSTVDAVLARPGVDRTKLTEWMETNKACPETRHLTYAEFPTQYTWDSTKRVWNLRKQGISIGRVYFSHPASGERFYLRMLLNHVRGCTSYEDIRTINGILYPTFKAACHASGLLGDDGEWVQCLEEASTWASGAELRRLFVTLLVHCQVIDAAKLWTTHYEALSDDIAYKQRKKYRLANLQLPNKHIESLALLDIETLLHKMGKSLKDFNGMPLPREEDLHMLGNRLLNEELDYDVDQQHDMYTSYYAKLNECQVAAYNGIIDSVDNDKGELFFIQGRGGTGKTFLWNTIVSKLRAEKKIVLPVATSGIAALLLPNGRTAHSRFRIPLNLTPESTCDIRHGTNLAALLQRTSLIIWDEAPMANRLCFEALDRSLRDVMKTRYADSISRPFGGITVVCGGDFRQILPVISKGTRSDIIDATLNSSPLWSSFKLYELTQNMRLLSPGIGTANAASIDAFDKWLLEIGDGSRYVCRRDETISVPPNLTPPDGCTPIDRLIESVYPLFASRYNDLCYLAERSILTPRNDMVKVVNDMMLAMLPGEGKTYLSSDTVCKGNVQTSDTDDLYPIEFLNSLTFNGMPSHALELKIGCPVMLMRNLNQAEGLCNGTRLVVKGLGRWSVRGVVLCGVHKGKEVTIPRIIMCPNDTKWPFKLNRRQLPLIPCFTMTINKSQGQSLKNVGVYLPQQVFAHGQLYVALSRVTSKDGLVIVNADEEATDKSLVKNVVYHETYRNLRD